MNEQIPRAVEEPTCPSVEQLQQGYELGRGETVQIRPVVSNQQRYQELVPDDRVDAVLADITIGDESLSSRIVVTQTSPNKTERRLGVDAQLGLSLLIPTPQAGVDQGNLSYVRIQMPLGEENKLTLGRNQQGQETLWPDTVSRDHCAIWADREGRIFVENHEPSNATVLVCRADLLEQ